MPDRIRDRRRDVERSTHLQDGRHLRRRVRGGDAVLLRHVRVRERGACPPGAKVVVLGSGPIRIGQGIEFDYCSVRAAMALRDHGVQSIMINSNPETVSTDFDASSRLYFEPLDEESVRDVLENETRRRRPGAARPRPVRRPDGDQPGRAAGPRRLRAARLGPARDRPGRGSRPVQRPARPSRHPAAAWRHRLDAAKRPSRWPSNSAIPCWCGRPSCSADGRWRSAATPTSCCSSPPSPRRSPARSRCWSTSTSKAPRSRSTPSATERRAHPGHHGARRARRRALGRQHRPLSGPVPDRRADRHDRRSTPPTWGGRSACAACSTSSTWSSRARCTSSKSTRAAAAPCRSCPK